MKYILSLIISGALIVSGFGQTRNVLVGTNNTVVQPTNFWSADASNARTGLGLGTAATNPATAFQPSSSTLSNLSTGIFTIAITNGGTGATNAITARTNLGLGWPALTNTNATSFRNAIGLGILNSVEFTDITAVNIFGSGNTNRVIDLDDQWLMSDGLTVLEWFTNAITIYSPISFSSNTIAAQTRTNLGLPWSGLTNTNAATFQAALFGSSTNPVLVNSNGEVVSPTNFWQDAPITTTFVESQPTTNSTNNITAARFLHIHSLNTNIVNVTNTIALPTNGSTFNGDIALVVHQGPTNSMTRVRSAGSTNDIAAMTRYNEAIEFVYYNNSWQFNHNEAFTEPIYFAGTNATANAAASRTNLGLGAINNVTFASVTTDETFVDNLTVHASAVFGTPIEFGGTNIAGYAAQTRTNLGLGAANQVTFDTVSASQLDASAGSNSVAFDPSGIAFAGTAAATTRINLGLGSTNDVNFGSVTIGGQLVYSPDGLQDTISGFEIDTAAGAISGVNGAIGFLGSLNFGGTNAAANAATTRTNLGLGGTNNVAFRNITSDGNIVISNQSAETNGLLFIYRTNNEPFLGLANLIASNNTTASNETLFRVGVAEATNKAAQFGFRSTNTNGNGVAVFSVFGYNALMMIGPSDPNAGTNPIQATVYSVSPTNKVMTLISTNTGGTIFHRPIEFETTINAATTRTNLGIPLAALTNTTVTNFQKAIFYTNTAPSNIGGNLGTIAAWIDIVASNGVTYKIPVYTNIP